MSIEIKKHHVGWTAKYNNGNSYVIGEPEMFCRTMMPPHELIPPKLEDLRIGPFESNKQANKVLTHLVELGEKHQDGVWVSWNFSNYSSSCRDDEMDWTGHVRANPNITPDEFFHYFGTTQLQDMVIGPFEDLAQMRLVWETLKRMGESTIYSKFLYRECDTGYTLHVDGNWCLNDKKPNTSPAAFLSQFGEPNDAPEQEIDRSMVIGDFESIEQVRAVWEKLKGAGEPFHSGDNTVIEGGFLNPTSRGIYWYENRIWACNTQGERMTITAAEFLGTVQVGNPHMAPGVIKPSIVTGTIKVGIAHCDCEMTASGINHNDPSCSQYVSLTKVQAPLALTTMNYTPKELNEMTRSEADIKESNPERKLPPDFYLDTATGVALTQLAILLGVHRTWGETDVELRIRAENA